MNDKYKKILELEKKLAEAEIPRLFSKIADGYKIAYINSKGNEIGDVVEHRYGYGLEAMGFNLETDVEGWLTVEEALGLFKKAHDAELAELKGGDL